MDPNENAQDKLEAMVDQCLDDPLDAEVASMSFEDTDVTVDPSSSSYSHEHSSSFPNSASTSSAAFNHTTDITASSSTNRDIFYCENYFDLNDILSQSNRVSVNFLRTIPNLGFLDPGAEDDKLMKGTKLGLLAVCLIWL